jgi:thymidylate synthase
MDLPVIQINYPSLAKGWETAVLRCYGEGIDVVTEYDKPYDAKTKEISLFLSIENPFSEPRIHKCMPGGIEDLATYTLEVLYGIHDHWIDDAAGKWSYTYHQRIENQLQYIIDDLVRDQNTRRAQCTVWRPEEDCGHPHPVCLQRLWLRIIDDKLVMSAHMRSNDAFKACFMNMFAFTEIQKYIAKEVSKKLNRVIDVGQYNHIVDSFHIYGSYLPDFIKFMDTLKVRSFEDRTYRTSDVIDIIEEVYNRYGYSYI